MDGKYWWWIGGGVVALGGGGYAVYRLTRPAPPAFAAQLPPQAYRQAEGPNSGFVPLIGPGFGNQPNGQYTLAAQFTAPVTGTYTLQVAADDAATLILDGHVVGTVDYLTSFNSSLPVTGPLSLAAGTHTLIAEMSNNALGTNVNVPYGSGKPNPTGLYLTIVSADGKTILTTRSSRGWHYSGYDTQSTITAPQTITVASNITTPTTTF